MTARSFPIEKTRRVVETSGEGFIVLVVGLLFYTLYAIVGEVS